MITAEPGEAAKKYQNSLFNNDSNVFYINDWNLHPKKVDLLLFIDTIIIFLSYIGSSRSLLKKVYYVYRTVNSNKLKAWYSVLTSFTVKCVSRINE